MATTPADSPPPYSSDQPTYHDNEDAVYILPNDDVEHTRLEESKTHIGDYE